MVGICSGSTSPMGKSNPIMASSSSASPKVKVEERLKKKKRSTVTEVGGKSNSLAI